MGLHRKVRFPVVDEICVLQSPVVIITSQSKQWEGVVTPRPEVRSCSVFVQGGSRCSTRSDTFAIFSGNVRKKGSLKEHSAVIESLNGGIIIVPGHQVIHQVGEMELFGLNQIQSTFQFQFSGL